MKKVVNCFQIVSLRYWWHRSICLLSTIIRCELLSDCIFEVLVTPFVLPHVYPRQLWIAFRLYLWGIGDTHPPIIPYSTGVVNCFQIVSLRYWWHPGSNFITFSSRCELLSDCIFEVLVTPPNLYSTLFWWLWIAFRLYLWGIGDTTYEQGIVAYSLWIAFRLYLWGIGDTSCWFYCCG